MNERNWERVAGYAGVVAVLAFVVPGFVGTGTMPKPSDPDTTFKTYMVMHHAAVMRMVWLQALGAVLILWLATGIRSHLARRDDSGGHIGNLVFGLFGLAAAILGVMSAVEGGLAYRVVAETSPATVRLYTDVVAFLGNGVLGLTTMLAAAVLAVAVLANGSMSRAVGWISAAAAAVSLATSLTVFTTRGFFSLEGSFLLIQLIVTMIWLLALSVNLIQPARAEAPAAVAPMVPAS